MSGGDIFSRGKNRIFSKVTALFAKMKWQPLAQEERVLRLQLKNEPERLDLVQRLCAVLGEQGKEVPLELEEQSLRLHLEHKPNNVDLLQRLCAVLGEQGKEVPLELEEHTIRQHLHIQPDRADLIQRLARVEEMLVHRDTRPDFTSKLAFERAWLRFIEAGLVNVHESPDSGVVFEAAYDNACTLLGSAIFARQPR